MIVLFDHVIEIFVCSNRCKRVEVFDPLISRRLRGPVWVFLALLVVARPSLFVVGSFGASIPWTLRLLLLLLPPMRRLSRFVSFFFSSSAHLLSSSFGSGVEGSCGRSRPEAM